MTALRSFAENRDVGRVQFLDFDVLAAHCFIEGKPLVPSPHMVLDPPEEEIASVLGLYSNMIDRIWELFGGFSRAGFEEPALWMMDKRQVVGLHSNTLGAAFAAFLYADIDRARQFLVELETCWERRARDEPANLAVHELRGQVLEDVSRARLIIGS